MPQQGRQVISNGFRAYVWILLRVAIWQELLSQHCGLLYLILVCAEFSSYGSSATVRNNCNILLVIFNCPQFSCILNTQYASALLIMVTLSLVTWRNRDVD
jgi:hypothetical protein